MARGEAAQRSKLTLGPILYHWSADEIRAFYARIADEAPIDTAILGEVVCSKRTPFIAEALIESAERLAAAGKEVVLATPAMIMEPREMAAVQALAADGGFPVEANDMAAHAVLKGRPHLIGPFVNLYNEGTLAVLAREGATRVCLPPELPRASSAALSAHPLVEKGALELEIWAFGRLPLAISARCHHARLVGRSKDSCQYVCGEAGDGVTVESLDGEAFLAINGVQTLSFAYASALGRLEDLAAIGIRRFRLSPQRTDMAAVARIFRDVLDGRTAAGEAAARLTRQMPGATFCDGFLAGREGRALLGEND